MAKPPYKRDDPSLSAIRAYKGAVITDERNTSLSDYAVADRDFAVTDETGRPWLHDPGREAIRAGS